MMPFDPVSFARLSHQLYMERVASALGRRRVEEPATRPESRHSPLRASGARGVLRSALAVVLSQAR
jgi:hypothetical protein